MFFSYLRKLLKTKKRNFLCSKYNNYFHFLWIRYELELDLNADFTLKDCLFRGVKLANNAHPDNCAYTGYGIGFDSSSKLSLTDGSVIKNVTIFGVDMSSSKHIDNKKKDTLILGKGLTQGLDDTTLVVEAQYSINFSRSIAKFFLSMHYNGSNSSLFVNTIKIY